MLNPLYLAMIACGLIAVSGLTGFVGGCQYKGDKIAAEKLEATKHAAKLESKDTASGVRGAAELRKKENEISASLPKIQAEASRKPLVTVSCPSAPSQIQVPAKEDTQLANSAKEGEVNEPPSAPNVILTADFKRLYDLSFYPEYAQIRAGTYESTRETSIVQGFNNFIAPNNASCRRNWEKLEALQTTIREKQKLYSEYFKD